MACNDGMSRIKTFFDPCGLCHCFINNVDDLLARLGVASRRLAENEPYPTPQLVLVLLKLFFSGLWFEGIEFECVGVRENPLDTLRQLVQWFVRCERQTDEGHGK